MSPPDPGWGTGHSVLPEEGGVTWADGAAPSAWALFASCELRHSGWAMSQRPSVPGRLCRPCCRLVAPLATVDGDRSACRGAPGRQFRDPARPGRLGQERGKGAEVLQHGPAHDARRAGLQVPCRPGFSDSGSFPRGSQETAGLVGAPGVSAAWWRDWTHACTRQLAAHELTVRSVSLPYGKLVTRRSPEDPGLD